MSNRRATSKARLKQGIRHYGAFARDDLMAGAMAALGFLRTIEPEPKDVEAAWRAFGTELLADYKRHEGDMSQLALPRCGAKPLPRSPELHRFFSFTRA